MRALLVEALQEMLRLQVAPVPQSASLAQNLRQVLIEVPRQVNSKHSDPDTQSERLLQTSPGFLRPLDIQTVLALLFRGSHRKAQFFPAPQVADGCMGSHAGLTLTEA